MSARCSRCDRSAKLAPHHEHFFRMARRNLFARRHAPSRPRQHGEGIPRLADTVAVEMPGLEIRVHLRRRNDHDPHVAVRLDALRAQPLAQEKGVRGAGVDRPEGEGLIALLNCLAQRPPIAHAFFPQGLREGDGVAVQAHHQAGKAFGLDRTEPATRRHDQPRRGVRRFEFAIDDLVANRRPAHLAMQFDSQAVFRIQPEFLRHDDRRAVRQRHEPEAQGTRADVDDFWT